MFDRSILVIGGSAGAIQGVSRLLTALPADLPAAILLVIHIQPTGAEWLTQRFAESISLPVSTPVPEGQPLREGHVYVAPPDRHLIVKENSVRTSHGPRENMWRPAIDVLFRTAAVAHDSRVIGILLSGELDDGTAGLQAIRTCGGVTIVQAPEDATAPAMPLTALANVRIDYTVPIDRMPALLRRIVAEPPRDRVQVPESLRWQAAVAEEADAAEVITRQKGELTPPSCPECSGPLWRGETGGPHFRCLVGHAFHVDSLVEGSDQELNRTLWAAIRLFEQRANIALMLAEQERVRANHRRSALHMERATEARRHAQRLRELQAQTLPLPLPEL